FSSELARSRTGAKRGGPDGTGALAPVTSAASAASGQLTHGLKVGTTTLSIPRRPVTAAFPLPVPPPGGALDHLVIPAIGVTRYVVQGVSDADLQMGPGHYPGTPLPGQLGNVAIAGHRTTFGAPFFRLNEVVPGDLIYLTDISGTTWVYAVRHIWVVVPTDTAVLATTHQADLTLTTCNPRFEALSRLVVRAALLEHLDRGTLLPSQLPITESGQRALGIRSSTPPTAPNRSASASPAPSAPSGPASRTALGARANSTPYSQSVADNPTMVASPSSQSLPSDSTPETAAGGTWAATLSWGALALLAWVATRVAAARLRRYSKVVVLAAGALLCLVPLWFAFENLVDLLPASI
ncbi:MAG TPA: class E sortase, partial [Acidimicrobiales bacterium]|nr:class E sortase [Acidimicrobiales bacterium]